MSHRIIISCVGGGGLHFSIFDALPPFLPSNLERKKHRKINFPVGELGYSGGKTEIFTRL